MAEQICIAGTVLLMMVVDFNKMAVEFKKFFGLDSSQKFPALSIAENSLCFADDDFVFNVVADKDWKYKDSVQAYYRHSKNRHEIGIKESVYNKARAGDKTALVSIAHEISHWGLINHFKIDLGILEQLDPVSKAILNRIHENITDLLTALLVFNEEELLRMNDGKSFDFGSCMGSNQLALAAYYCKHHKLLTENFFKNIAPKIWEQNQFIRRLSNA